MSIQEQGKASEGGGRGGGAEGEPQPEVGTDGVAGSQRAITQPQTQPTLATDAGETEPSTGRASPPYEHGEQHPIEDPERAAVIQWGREQAEFTMREADARVGEFAYEYNFESDEDAEGSDDNEDVEGSDDNEDVEGSDDNEDDSNDDAACTPLTFASLPDFPDDDEDDPDYVPEDNDSDLELDAYLEDEVNDSDDHESVIRDKFRFHRWLTALDDDDNDDAAQRRHFWRSRFGFSSATASPHGGNDE